MTLPLVSINLPVVAYVATIVAGSCLGTLLVVLVDLWWRQ